MLSAPLRTWRGLPPRRKVAVVLAALLTVACLWAALRYMADSDGLSIVDPENPGASYVLLFTLIALDAVIPIFPGETTLNAASTAAADGTLELVPVIVMGALGAIVGDSALFWLARRYSRRIQPQLEAARRNAQVRKALDVMSSSAPVLIVGGRYAPGLRFVVNATMGLSTVPYRTFVKWSILSGVLWSTYTCLLAYNVALTIGDYPLASMVISGLVTTVAISVVFMTIRRHQKSAGSDAPAEGSDGSPSEAAGVVPEAAAGDTSQGV